ncbi:MAG: UDP-3-O-(3-hydroxymyristoyl)glucosamine N-acyltransferase [Burkholderiales bacterium]|nr:UDP-3-O-(3-hydroxymyristoyl)glucosamine N-acyltransferase [Burkholderiales bacterium]
MKIRLSELIKLFGGNLVGDDVEITDIAPTNLVKSGQITFLTDSKYKTELVNCYASAIIVAEKDAQSIGIAKIITDNPYWYFSQVSQLFHPRRLVKSGIKSTVVQGENVDIGENPSIGHYVVLGDDVVIGKNCQIHSHVVIGNNVKIGDNVTIYPHVTIYDLVNIGNDCVFHSGVVIGSDGFGNATDKIKHWSRIPQIGGVLIGNNVDIGANTTVDCGTFTPTIIENGVVIDNLVQIAHNVVIGAYSGIAAGVAIAGSTTIGKHCQLGGCCMITGHIKIADYTVVGAATGISKSITKPDLYFSVYPFTTLKEWAKNAVHVKHLHSMYERLKNIEQQVKQINGVNNDK